MDAQFYGTIFDRDINERLWAPSDDQIIGECTEQLKAAGWLDENGWAVD